MNRLLLIFVLFLSFTSFGQAPKGFKYQAVVRDANGVLVYNQIISIKTSILKDTPTGTVVYSEKHTLSTSDNGVASLSIGEGAVLTGDFSLIDWSQSTFFIKTELDLSGGSNFQFMGTSQILSVPFALYAEKSKIAISDNDTSATNELQNLSITGHNLSIANGNTIVIPPDNDSDPTNENQTLQIVGDSLKISNGNAVLLTGNVDLDASPLNELQTLTLNGNQLSITNGNSIILPPDNDSNPTNEFQNLSINAGTISLSNANQIHIPDSSATNEIQTLTINGSTLSLSNSNSITIPDSSSFNELQTLSIIGDSLYISNGNSVKIKEHYVGELWGGGIVCHVYKDTLGVQHGLIMSKRDLSNDAVTESTPSIPNSTNLCLNYSYTDNSGTYDDWRLPTGIELSQLFHQLPNLINSNGNNLGGLGSGYYYWSSGGGGSSYNLYTLTKVNNMSSNWPQYHYVRAVRTF
jgi:hypothetical protein